MDGPRQGGKDLIASLFGKDAAAVIESHIYNHTIASAEQSSTPRNWDNPAFAALYEGNVRRIVRVLQVEGEAGPHYERLRADPAAISEFVAQTELQLAPAGFANEVLDVESRSKIHVELKTSELWKCPKCGERKTTYREVQTRSADEPATIFCICTNCHANFVGV